MAQPLKQPAEEKKTVIGFGSATVKSPMCIGGAVVEDRRGEVLLFFENYSTSERKVQGQ